MSHYVTRIARENFEQICNSNMTPSELIDFLEKGALYRSFSDVLREVYPGEDLEERLKTRLLGMSQQPLTAREQESLRKNISNWMKGKNMPQSREQLFRICFALGLGEAQTSRVLARASETGIHYRDPKELVYAFALRTELDYHQAVMLHAEMEKIYQPIVKAAEQERIAAWKTREQIYRERRATARRRREKLSKVSQWNEPYVGELNGMVSPSFLTQQVSHQFEKVTDREGLRRFFEENSVSLGVIHESAYEKFWQLLLVLQEPDDLIIQKQDNEMYSLDKIVETYFRMHIPRGKESRKFDYLQKAVKKNWPNVAELQKMKARKTDVSRKSLLLLFLITEDFLLSEDLQYSDHADEDAAWFLPEEDESPRDQLEVVLSKINLFLETYGMNQLDPGNPFDCLVLYALAAEYGEGFLSDKFNDALEELFTREMEQS